ncbi:MAG TPA: hypothetical protein VKR22_02000 [Acidimicrobiales bacterium]|nr:hypothetical protein [Acidimicrobiales bacterium]
MENQDSPDRSGPHLVLGILTALSLGAIVLSVDFAPADAPQQLQVAAANTLAAGSFVLHESFSLRPTSATAPGSPARRETVEVVYQSPDKVEEKISLDNKSGTLLILGTARYARSQSGPWLALGPQDHTVPTGTVAAAEVVQPIRALLPASRVAAHGERYSFDPVNRALLLDELLGAAANNSPTPPVTTFEATVAGEFLTGFTMTAGVLGQDVVVSFRFGSFDHAPALVAPPVAGR